MEQSPFPYHGPLSPQQVTGRDDLVAELAQRVADRRLTALLGPRRYGKTSLLRRVVADLADVGYETVWVDLYEMASMADVAAALDRGLDALAGPLRKALDALAHGLSLSVGMVGIELSRPKREQSDPVLVLRGLLDALVRAADRHRICVVFDEFSGIADVPGAAGVLRTGLQHHFADLGIVFAGSETSTMTMLFADRAQPFFAQADLVEIGPLSDAAVWEVVESGFAHTGRSTGGLTNRIVAMAQGHPQRAMQLADALWRHVPFGEAAEELHWAAALSDVSESVESGFERIYAMLPAGHQRTLRAIATSGSIYGRAAQTLGLAPGTAKAATDSLAASGHLRIRDGSLQIVDPLLDDWLRRRFPL